MEVDFVIGNPPYVRLENIPEETATLYRDAYPTITVIRRHTQGTTVVAWAEPDAGAVGAQTLSATLLATAQREPLALPRGLRIAPWSIHGLRDRTLGPVIR